MMKGSNQAPRGDGPTTDVLSPFPAWQPAAPEETPADESLAQRSTHAMSRGLKSSASAASSVQSAAAPPSQQQQSRPKRFNLRDGAREAIKTMREQADAKQMIVALPLYDFYNTEISLHFLHALSAYFIRVAKDVSLERRRQDQTLPPQPAEREEEARHDGGRERASLLREVGRSYGRVIVYCSNFEITTADALFFESLLCLARMVVAAAVAEPSLATEIDKEFDRILRGGVFHPAPISPAPRPPTRPRRTPPRQSPRGDPRRNLGGRPATGNGLDGASGDGDGHGRNPGKRRGILEAGGSLFASPESTRGGDTRGFLGGGGKKRRGRPPGGAGRRTGPAVEPGSSRGSADRTSSTLPPTRPSSSREFAGGGGGVAAGSTSTPSRTSSHRGRGGSPTSHDARDGTRGAFAAARGGRKQRLRGRSPNEKAAPGGDEEGGTAAPFPAFDELSRWKVTRASVPRMVRLAGEAQHVALSNLALAEGYRRALAAELHKKMSSALPADASANANTTAASAINQTATPSKPDATAPSPAAAAAGKRCPFWKRRGRALTPRKKQSGGVRPAAGGRNGEKEFFCAEALSVCIGSIVGS